MDAANGVSPIKSISNRFRINTSATWFEIALLVGLGIAIVALRAAFRGHLGLHGRHGVEWMALLLIGRMASRNRGAATISSIGAATCVLLPIWGFRDPFGWLIYLWVGIVLDTGYALGKRWLWHDSLWFLVLLGGLAHATKPLVRLLISLISGWPYGSLIFGVAYPLALHIFFGIAGSLVGIGLLRFLRQNHKD